MSSASVTHALAEIVESVLARLKERGITTSSLADEWQAIGETTAEERDFCIAAARVGFDPYSLPADLARVLERAAAELEEQLLADFLDAVDPTNIASELEWVQQTTKDIDELVTEPSTKLEELRKQTPACDDADRALPWSTGYRQARHVRDVVGLIPTEPFPLDGLITYEESLLATRGFQGLGAKNACGGEILMLSRRFPEPAVRFAGARALWHFVHEASHDRFVLTSAHGDRQRISRSFAAELLAPADGIRELLGDCEDMVSDEDVEQVAATFRVSSLVVEHQIVNQLTPA